MASSSRGVVEADGEHSTYGMVEVVKVDVPKVVSRGAEVQLGCRWRGGGGRLYSLKWYLDDKEFFRYLPEEKPSMLSRPLPGVTVDVSTSTVARV